MIFRRGGSDEWGNEAIPKKSGPPIGRSIASSHRWPSSTNDGRWLDVSQKSPRSHMGPIWAVFKTPVDDYFGGYTFSKLLGIAANITTNSNRWKFLVNFSFSEKISCFKWSALMEIPMFDDFPNKNPALFSGGSMSSRPLPERQDPDRWSPRPGIDGKKDIFFTKTGRI